MLVNLHEIVCFSKCLLILSEMSAHSPICPPCHAVWHGEAVLKMVFWLIKEGITYNNVWLCKLRTKSHRSSWMRYAFRTQWRDSSLRLRWSIITVGDDKISRRQQMWKRRSTLKWMGLWGWCCQSWGVDLLLLLPVVSVKSDCLLILASSYFFVLMS